MSGTPEGGIEYPQRVAGQGVTGYPFSSPIRFVSKTPSSPLSRGSNSHSQPASGVLVSSLSSADMESQMQYRFRDLLSNESGFYVTDHN